MTPHEHKRIADWKTKIKNPQDVRLVLVNGSRNRDIQSFCETVGAALALPVRREQTEDQMPGIVVNERITYHALPLGPELEPFLNALILNSIPANPKLETVKQLTVPSFLTLYITPQCPFCPAVVEQLLPLVNASHLIQLSIIDGTMFPEMAVRDEIQSAPTLVFDTFRWTGRIDAQEIAGIIQNQDPLNLSANSLRDIIQNGDASRVAGMMMERNVLFPAFFDLLVHEKWPVRLGAMVVMEEIIDSAPELALTMVPPLLDRFGSLIEQVKGDMVYLMGEAGDRATMTELEAMLPDVEGPELQAVIQEAIGSIRKRYEMG